MICMKKKDPFSIRARGRSLKYAMAGIRDFFGSQHNALIHLLATTTVLLLAIVVHVSVLEMIALVVAAGFVWTAELLNTAIEGVMDFISDKQDDRIRYIKDLSAAAVLVAAITAMVVGCLVFIPKI